MNLFWNRARLSPVRTNQKKKITAAIVLIPRIPHAWHWGIAGLLWAIGSTALAASLSWSPRTNNLWNLTSPNWVGDRTTFQTGDTVFFGDGVPASAGTVVIATRPGAPTELTILPASMTISNASLAYAFEGGVIGSGSITKLGRGSAAFEGSYVAAPTHTFDGGTFVREGRFIVGLRTVEPDGYHFGRGPIEIDGGEFNLHVRYFATTLENDFRVTSRGGRLDVTRDYDLVPFIGSATFDGDIHLGGPLALDGWADFEKDLINGRVIVDQAAVGPRSLDFDGPMELSGPIVDGPGAAANPLLLANRSGFNQMLRITNPSNTYAGGTIVGAPNLEFHPSLGPDYDAVEVTPWSSLGRGPVFVESNAVLRLLGEANLNTNAYLYVRGVVYLPENVTLQVSELALGSAVYRSGLFSRTNQSQHIFGEGMIRVVRNGDDAPRIESIRRDTNEGVVVTFKAAPFKTYELETASSLVNPAWTIARTIEPPQFPTPTPTLVAVTNSIQRQDPTRFFRLTAR